MLRASASESEAPCGVASNVAAGAAGGALPREHDVHLGGRRQWPRLELRFGAFVVPGPER